MAIGPVLDRAIAFVFAMPTLYGYGAEPVLDGVLILLLGIPIYVWQRRHAIIK